MAIELNVNNPLNGLMRSVRRTILTDKWGQTYKVSRRDWPGKYPKMVSHAGWKEWKEWLPELEDNDIPLNPSLYNGGN